MSQPSLPASRAPASSHCCQPRLCASKAAPSRRALPPRPASCRCPRPAARLLVGAFDRATNTLHLAHAGWRCGLQQHPKPAAAAEDDAPPDAAAAATLRKRELVDEFGSKKARKKQKAAALRVVDETNMAGRQVLERELVSAGGHAARALEEAAAAREATEASTRAHVPRYDLAATEPLDAYPLESVVPAEVWPDLPHEALREAIAEAPDDASLEKLVGALEGVTRAAADKRIELDALRRLRDELGGGSAHRAEATTVRQNAELRALLFLRHLLAFKALPSVLRDRAPKGHTLAAAERAGDAAAHPLAARAGIPSRVWRFLVTRFTDASLDDSGKPMQHRSAAGTHRLMCHAIVLCVRLSRNAMRIDLASSLLGIDKSRVTTYTRELGCHVGSACPAHAPPGTQAAGARYAQIRLPLTFPMLKRPTQTKR